MTGLWQRQQCGYGVLERLRGARAGRAPCQRRLDLGLASNTRLPAEQLDVLRKWPPGPTGA